MSPDRVAEAARRYVPGAGAVSVERLGRGLVNESHRVVRDGRVYSLRMPAKEPAPTGVDREWECRVLALVSAVGLAPTIERCEPRLGVLVAQWQEGRALRADEARAPDLAVRVTELARRVHALPLPGNARVLGPADWIAHYLDARTRLPPGARQAPRMPGRAAGADALQAEAGRRLGALEALPPTPRVLCHSDLHSANLVETEGGGLVLLDWEYAHVSEALWDVAGWACNNDFSPAARAFLLASYLGRPASAEEAQRLEYLAWLYDYVCLLWSEVYCGAARAANGLIIERGRILAARLLRAAGGDVAELPAN
jgi:thiamine kinase-like enzyme